EWRVWRRSGGQHWEPRNQVLTGRQPRGFRSRLPATPEATRDKGHTEYNIARELPRPCSGTCGWARSDSKLGDERSSPAKMPSPDQVLQAGWRLTSVALTVAPTSPPSSSFSWATAACEASWMERNVRSQGRDARVGRALTTGEMIREFLDAIE